MKPEARDTQKRSLNITKCCWEVKDNSRKKRDVESDSCQVSQENAVHRTGGQKPDIKELGSEWVLKKTEHEDYAFRKSDVLEKWQRTQTLFATYSLTRNPNCCLLNKIIGTHFVSRHLGNLLAGYLKITLSPTKLINSVFVQSGFFAVRIRLGNQPFSKVNSGTVVLAPSLPLSSCPSRMYRK